MDESDLAALAELRDRATADAVRPAPILVIDEFLSRADHDDVLARLRSAEPDFWSNAMPGRDALAVVDTPATTTVLDAIGRRFEEFIDAIGALGAPVDELDECRLEPGVVTASGHGSHHAPHFDNDPLAGVPQVVTRRISFVWYAFDEPRAFEGGGLRVWDHATIPSERGPWTAAPTWTDVECVSNRLVVFSSFSRHEVLTVRMPAGAFADRRFAVVTAAHAHTTPDRN